MKILFLLGLVLTFNLACKPRKHSATKLKQSSNSSDQKIWQNPFMGSREERIRFQVNFIEAGRSKDMGSNNEFRIGVEFYHSHDVLPYYEYVHTFKFDNFPMSTRKEFPQPTNATAISMSLNEFVNLVQKNNLVQDWSKAYLLIRFYEADPLHNDALGQFRVKSTELEKLKREKKPIRAEHIFHDAFTDSKAKVTVEIYEPGAG